MFAGIHVHHVKMFVTASSLSSELSRVGHEVCIAADWLVFFCPRDFKQLRRTR